jgi:predicted ATPase
MFAQLRLTNFKSFPDAVLRFGSITTVIGANATGKSNLRDALKFLHAAGRGLTLPEIFGGKSSVGWAGIRGGAPGTVREGAKSFRLQLTAADLVYDVEIATSAKTGPLVTHERLTSANTVWFETVPNRRSAKVLEVRLVAGGDYKICQKEFFPAHQPMLSQVAEATSVRSDRRANQLVIHITTLRSLLANIRFIDFSPTAMRQPSVPGEKRISESGDNLSSVLRYLVEDQNKETVLASWIKVLTPMDVANFSFEDYPDGKILGVIEEAGGRKVPLSSASDGTLRFLGILASVISPEPPSLLCFEEIETGLHPVRVQLVSELLQKETVDGRPQVLLTTHSPALVGWLGHRHRDNAHLAYRLPGMADTRLRAFQDIPTIETALASAEAAKLFETGWFEETMSFAESDAPAISFIAEDGEKA